MPSYPMTPQALEVVASRFKILSEQIRLRILHLLERGEMSVGQITEQLQTTQPNASKHLKILQDAGLLARRQAGNTVYYSIADPTVYELCELVCRSIHDRLSSQADLLRPSVSPRSRKK